MVNGNKVSLNQILQPKNNESLKRELVFSTVDEVKEPQLGGVGSVMQDATTHEGFLLL